MVCPPYQRAVRLSAAATQNWQQVDGYYSGKGVDILNLPLSRYLSVIHTWAMQAQSQEDAEKWERDLDKRIPGQVHYEVDVEAELAQLKNM